MTYLGPNENDSTIQCISCENLPFNAILTKFEASTFHSVELSSDLTSECRFHNEMFVQGENYLLRAMIRHIGAHFTCAVATYNNSFLFDDDMMIGIQ